MTALRIDLELWAALWLLCVVAGCSTCRSACEQRACATSCRVLSW